MTRFSAAAVRDDFSRAAFSYDEEAHLQRTMRAACAERLLRLFDSHSVLHLLDAGCGTGALAEEFAADKAWNLTGMDVAPAMCEVASGRLHEVVSGPVEQMPFADAYFDAAVCSLVLQWVNNLPAACRELKRVVKAGGYAVIASLGPDTLHELRTCFSQVDEYPHVSEFTSRERMVEHAVQAGWRVMDVETQNHVSEHPDVFDLIRHLKLIGASNKVDARKRGLTTWRAFDRVEQEYRARFVKDGMLQATWQTYLIVLKRP